MTNLGNRRWWALGALTLAVLAVGLDGTVLSVALPTLATALHASESDLQWFSSGYLLVLAAAMLPAGLPRGRYCGHNGRVDPARRAPRVSGGEQRPWCVRSRVPCVRIADAPPSCGDGA